ncbi:hypothetical protein DdX_15547 [Ditylenchus destructor]|uniref:G-protein coupled receptors family 1 profile domain-containing protein n=1 Tax=Ditylenchus destructor TaxID=166010 RepID=A0AAD4MQ73_9BILA|nr:hypothetical protein DdX_15547 [Ditylenchus destructor]
MFRIDDSNTELDACGHTNGPLYDSFITSYSAVVSVAFFVAYISSLFLFSRQMARIKAQTVHSQERISNVQLRLFSTVSIALTFYTIFYVVPTTMQLVGKYFQVPNVALIAYYAISYGAALDGVINVIIYLLKHHEFKECNLRLISKFIGKTQDISHTNDTNQAGKVRTVRSAQVIHR